MVAAREEVTFCLVEKTEGLVDLKKASAIDRPSSAHPRTWPGLPLLLRLAGLGVVPGAVIHFQQKTPAAVLRVGETTLALDPAIAAEIYVRRVDGVG